MITDSFIRLIKTHKPKLVPATIFDVGSRDCLQSVEISNAFPSAMVCAFEPNPKQHDVCQWNARGHNITVLPVAVSDSDGIKPFGMSTTANVGYSSLFPASGKYDHIEKMPFAMTQVLAIRLDTFIRITGIEPPEVLWMDAQGSELAGLRGLGKHIDSVQAIWTEVCYRDMYAGQPLRDEVVEWCKSHNLNLVLEEVCLRDPVTEAPWWGDACFIRP